MGIFPKIPIFSTEHPFLQALFWVPSHPPLGCDPQNCPGSSDNSQVFVRGFDVHPRLPGTRLAHARVMSGARPSFQGIDARSRVCARAREVEFRAPEGEKLGPRVTTRTVSVGACTG